MAHAGSRGGKTCSCAGRLPTAKKMHPNELGHRWPLPSRDVERYGRRISMIGMSFSSFLSLLILGSIAAIVLHFVVLYKMLRNELKLIPIIEILLPYRST